MTHWKKNNTLFLGSMIEYCHPTSRNFSSTAQQKATTTQGSLMLPHTASSCQQLSVADEQQKGAWKKTNPRIQPHLSPDCQEGYPRKPSDSETTSKDSQYIIMITTTSTTITVVFFLLLIFITIIKNIIVRYVRLSAPMNANTYMIHYMII